MAILGLIAGYTFMLLQSDNALASGKVCNAHKEAMAADITE